MSEKHSAAHNLPFLLAPFIGREWEITEIRNLLSQTRLLTLTGIGGSGKTRLAIQVSYQLVDEFPGGIRLVELSEISNPSFVPQAIATTLGLYQEPGKSIIETLVNFLKSSRVLLVLDNCEHLLEACAQVAQTLLFSCPHVQILATSRQSLQISGEISWQVGPLSLPDSNLSLSPQEAMQYTAVQLFVDRARSISPTFAITQHNVFEIAQVCRRLDGIPLAIELAAAWANVLSIAQIDKHLDESLPFLVWDHHTVPARQQSLRAVLDWSYGLLSEKERVLFRRLALFISDFSLTAVEAICVGDGLEEHEILSLLSQLVRKSLVWVGQQNGQEKRFRLLEVVRQYSLEKCSAFGDTSAVSDRFLDYYLALSEKAVSEFSGPRQVKWVSVLEQELNHFRTALNMSQEQPNRVERGLRLANALIQFWQLRGYLSEGARWLEELLACSSGEPTLLRANSLDNASFMVFFQEDYDRASALAEEALEIYQKLDDYDGVASIINQLAFISLALGDYEQANVYAGQCLAVLEEKEIDDPMLKASVLLCIGDTAFFQKDMARAVSSAQAGLKLCRDMGNRWATARRLARLGQLSSIQGHFRQALEYLEEGLTLSRDAGDKWSLVWNLAALGEVAAELDQMENAARFLTGAGAILEVFATRLRPVDRVLYENCEGVVKAQLGEQRYQAIGRETHSMTLEQIVEFAVAYAGQMRSDPLWEAGERPMHSSTPRQQLKAEYSGLTAREREVAALVAQGKSNAAIAKELFVGIRTVEAHITRILTKLNFTSRTQIAGWAIHKGLAPPPK